MKIEYAADLPHVGHFQGQGDSPRWLPNNFTFVLTDTQISSIQNASTEGKQNYRGTCDDVIHYNYETNNYSYAFGFRFHDNTETVSQQ